MIDHVNVIHVHFMRGLEKISLGRLVLKDRKIYFEYTPEFLKTRLEISPYKLPLRPGVTVCEDRVFEGLFGVFNDSLPDGWGRLLLDRKLMKLGIHPGELTPLDRLRYVGKQGMGALIYEPEMESSFLTYHEDLDTLADESLQFQENDDERFVDELLFMNGSSAGARPKILITFYDDSFQRTDNVVKGAHNDWIIKFRSSFDPKDSGPIEYAYHLMARDAGLDVPEAKLFKSKKGPGYFGVKRFDRTALGFFHMHTVSGLLHVDHRIPSFDYETLMKATLWLTKDVRECEKQFRHAVFNVLAHNRDDHVKNFSYLMDKEGTWRVSPAYDLTFSLGPAGEHCTLIMGEGKHPTIAHLLKLAAIGGIKERQASEIIDQVKAAISRWPIHAQEAHVTQKSVATIQAALTSIPSSFRR